MKFCFQFVPGERVSRISFGVVYCCAQPSAIGCDDLDAAQPFTRIGAVHFWIQRHTDPGAEACHLFALQCPVLEIEDACASVYSDQSQHGAHGELCLVDGCGLVHHPEHVYCGLVHFCGDGLNLTAVESVFLH